MFWGGFQKAVYAKTKACEVEERLPGASEYEGIQLVGGGHSGGIRGAFKGHSNLKKGIQDFGGHGTYKNVWVFDMCDLRA